MKLTKSHMTWKVFVGLAVCATVGSGLATRTLVGQVQPQATADEYQQHVLPVLSKSCMTCHNDRAKAGTLSLEAFRDPSAALAQQAIWPKVLERVTAGTMPPANAVPLSAADRDAIAAWIRKLPGVADAALPRAGRVTARRLNRVEYNNTIRDLLGVAARPAEEFPVDDSGYGFDNNGDVLSVSPMLMEKYMQAGEKISRLAVYGETVPAKPTRLVRLMNRRSQDAYDVLTEGNSGIYLPYSLRGAMYGNFTFPVDGEYEFRLRIANFRGDDADITDEERARRAEERRKLFEARRLEREKAAAAAGTAAPVQGGRAGGPQRREPTPEELKARDEAARKAAPPRKLILTVDGAQVISTVIEGTGAFGYSQGEFTERATVKAGQRFIRASYPELANLDNPLENINPDMRRGLFVDYLDIVGPFKPSTAPPESYKKLFICSQKTAQCARTILSSLMERAYRRPVTEDELRAKLELVRLAQREGDSFDEGIRLALQAILASPNFLFRIEAPSSIVNRPSSIGDRRVPGAPVLAMAAQRSTTDDRRSTTTEYPVSDIELASRLSYFLWASMPDAELMRVAKAGTLRQPAVLEAQVRRMMADPKGYNLVENWAAQWLQLRNLGRTKPDPKRFPTVDDELLDAMRTETMKFVETIIKEDRSLLDFIDAPFTWVNGPLARHYGIKGIDGEEFQRVTLDGDQRSGVLTQGAILTVSSYPTRTSPPVRGKWVMENLLGAPPPPPPDNVPQLNDSNIGTEVSLRERLEQHRRDPNCSPCHVMMDPLGFGLENYDAVGAWRTLDGKFPIESSGTLPGGQSFVGSKGLKEILRTKSDAFVTNVTEKLLTYSLGRGLERFDRPTVETISRQVKASDYRFSALVMAVVKSQPFQMQTVEGARP
jgi:mono/diheme cytochrome c family protein